MELPKYFKVDFDTDPTYLSGILSYECKEVIDSIHAYYNIYWSIDWSSLTKGWAACNPDVSQEIIIELLQSQYSGIYTPFILAHHNCPAAVKLWLENDGYAGMSLVEFIDTVEN